MDVSLKWHFAKPSSCTAEESRENKWLSFKFQEQDKGDRRCECHSPHSIDFSTADAKEQSPEKRGFKHADPR